MEDRDPERKYLANRARYNITDWFYDILDYPWELQYRKWWPELLSRVSGSVLEVGVGTGRSLRHDPPVEKVYGARFDRNTLEHAKRTPGLIVTET